MLSDALEVFDELRDDRHQLEKKPGIAELLCWLDVLSKSDVSGSDPLREHPDLIMRNLSLLLKSRDDTVSGKEIIGGWLRQSADG